MALIGVLVQFTPLTTIKSADVNANFSAVQTAFNNTAVLTDTARTVTVSHTWTASQTFSGGATFGAGILFGTDNSYDIGAAGASRPRSIYVASSLTVGGTTTIGGSLVLGGNQIAQLGAVLFNTDNTSDIGASVASRPRNVYMGGQLAVGDYAGAFRHAGDIIARRTATVGALYFGDDPLAYLSCDSTAGVGYTFGKSGLPLTLNGGLMYGTDNAYDIGQSGNFRPRNLYLGGGIQTAGQIGIVLPGATDALVSFGTSGTTNAYIGTAAAANNVVTGSAAGDIVIRAVNHNVLVSTDNGASWALAVDSGNVTLKRGLLWGSDNAYDIGASGAQRPRNGYFAGTIYSASSRALKEGIRDTRTDALKLIRGTRVVDFRYKANPTRDKIGFIAEDTHELLSGPARKDFDVNNAIGLLLRATQQLADQLERAEHQLTQLKRAA